jgi:hypothetical protein
VAKSSPIPGPDTTGSYFMGDTDKLAIETKHRVLNNGDDSNATILIINNGNQKKENDFVILSKMTINPKSICDFSNSMMSHINTTSTRHGAASGFMFSDDE